MYSNSTYQYTYYIDVHVGRAIDYNYKVPYPSLLTFTLQQTEQFLFLRQWMWVWSGSGSWIFFFLVVIFVFYVLWFVLRLVLQFVRECTVLKVNC